MASNGLPEGWEQNGIGDTITINYGKGLKEDVRKPGRVPVYGSNGIVGQNDKPLTAGPTIIIGRKGTVGAVHYSAVPCWPIDTTYFVSEFRGLDPMFLTLALRRVGLAELDTSSAIPGLNRDNIYECDLLIPPLPEQRRIVAKVEELLTEVNTVRERLSRIPALLKRFRQSVLAAVCDGRLTESWREANPGVPSQKSEPKPASGADLDMLPPKWTIKSLKDVTRQVGDVDHKMPKAVSKGIPYVSPKDFTASGGIDYSNTKRISEADFLALCRKIRPEQGDILMSRYGTVGEIRVVDTDAPLQTSYSIAIIKTKPNEDLRRYLALALASDQVQTQVREFTRATSQPDLGLAHIRALQIPVPPVPEQREIVRRVEKLFKWADDVEGQVARATKRVEKLTQSVLAKAFRGELVPTEAELARREHRTYEPASVLLERIRAERAAQT